MPQIRYECNTCYREIELNVDDNGVGYLGKCNITNNCRGELKQIGINLNSTALSIPDDVNGLDNWIRRASLYNHVQEVPALQWVIKHRLNYNPTIQVHVGTNLVEITPVSITHIDENSTLIQLDTRQSGIATCIASTNIAPFITPPAVIEDSLVLMTPAAEFIIATHDETWPTTDLLVPLVFNFISLVSGSVIATVPYDFNRNIALLTTWSPGRVLIHGKFYTIRGVTIDVAMLRSMGILESAYVRLSTSINSNDVYMLFTESPYATTDSNLGVLSDMSILINNDCIFQNDLLYLNSGIIVDIFPSMKRL